MEEVLSYGAIFFYQICKCDRLFLWSQLSLLFLVPTILPLVNGFPVCIHQFLLQLSGSFLLMWPQTWLFIPILVLSTRHPRCIQIGMCPFLITLQGWALRNLSLLLVLSLTRPTQCSILALLSLSLFFFGLFFYSSWPSFVFSESICVSWVLPFLLASAWIPQLPLSWPTFPQIVQNVSCLQDFSRQIGCSISTTQSKRKLAWTSELSSLLELILLFYLL